VAVLLALPTFIGAYFLAPLWHEIDSLSGAAFSFSATLALAGLAVYYWRSRNRIWRRNS